MLPCIAWQSPSALLPGQEVRRDQNHTDNDQTDDHDQIQRAGNRLLFTVDFNVEQRRVGKLEHQTDQYTYDAADELLHDDLPFRCSFIIFSFAHCAATIILEVPDKIKI